MHQKTDTALIRRIALIGVIVCLIGITIYVCISCVSNLDTATPDEFSTSTTSKTTHNTENTTNVETEPKTETETSEKTTINTTASTIKIIKKAVKPTIKSTQPVIHHPATEPIIPKSTERYIPRTTTPKPTKDIDNNIYDGELIE